METSLASTDTKDPPVKLQTPPIKMVFAYDDSGFLAAMVSLDDGIGMYRGQTEYWHGAIGGTYHTNLRLQAVPLGAETEASIQDWVSPLPEAFTCRRIVSPSDWSRGSVTIPLNHASYLFWTQHPDNEREILGILFVVDAQQQITAAAWYRSARPATSGAAFSSRQFSRTMTLLLDRSGKPVADPNLIQQADWQYIMMPLP